MDEIIDLPDDHTPVKRPLAITIVCVINWTAGLFSSIAFAYAVYVHRVTPKAAMAFMYSLVCITLCVALWWMKRWAAITYIIVCVVMVLIMLETVTWVDAAVVPIVSVLVIEWYVRTFKALQSNR